MNKYLKLLAFMSIISFTNTSCGKLKGNNGAQGNKGQDAYNILIDKEVISNSTCLGYNISFIQDLDRNNIISSKDKLLNNYYVCNGKNGVDGVNGEKGDQGIPGVNGEKGDKGDNGESIFYTETVDITSTSCVVLSSSLSVKRQGTTSKTVRIYPNSTCLGGHFDSFTSSSKVFVDDNIVYILKYFDSSYGLYLLKLNINGVL